MTKSDLKIMIYDALKKSLRKYPHTREYFEYEFSTVTSTSNLKFLHKYFLDSDSIWSWFVFLISLVHLLLSFWDSPLHTTNNFIDIAFIQGICILIEVIDVSIRIYFLCLSSKKGGENKKCCRCCCFHVPLWGGELNPPSLRLSKENLRLTGSLRLASLFILLVEYLYRCISFSINPTVVDGGYIVGTAPLR
jgi:hypothetical protein